MFFPSHLLSLSPWCAAISAALFSVSMSVHAQTAKPSAWDEPSPDAVTQPTSAAAGDPTGTVVNVASEAAAPAKPMVQKFIAQPAVGEITRGLLALQAQGSVASPHSYAMPGVVAQAVYQRYLKSFEHPIPEKSGSTLDTKK